MRDRVRKELGLVVEPAQIDVVARELRVQFEPGVGERVRACLGRGVRRLDDVAHTAPEVDFVGGLRADQIVAEIVRLAFRAQRAVGRTACWR